MTTMNAERLKQLAEAYGADRRRWPEGERKAAETLLASDGPWTDRLLFDARQTDAALDASPRPAVSAALRDRVIASAVAAGLSPRKARLFWDRLVFWFGAGWAAAACAGVIAGASLTPHLTADDQADAVLYQSTLSGVDDTEVLG
jgi:anti-sigma-K factor RskA